MDWNSLPMEVVEVPTLDAFLSRVSNWTITYSHPCSWFLYIFFFCQTSTTANTPSYRCQSNRHIDCGPVNERRRRRSLSSFHLPRVSLGEQLSRWHLWCSAEHLTGPYSFWYIRNSHFSLAVFLARDTCFIWPFPYYSHSLSLCVINRLVK